MATNSAITPELLDQLLANYEKPEDLTGDDGLFKQLKKALIERALGAGSPSTRRTWSRHQRALLQLVDRGVELVPGLADADRRAGAFGGVARGCPPRSTTRIVKPRAMIALLYYAI